MYIAGEENKYSPNVQIASLNKEKEAVCLCAVKVLVNSNFGVFCSTLTVPCFGNNEYPIYIIWMYFVS